MTANQNTTSTTLTAAISECHRSILIWIFNVR